MNYTAQLNFGIRWFDIDLCWVTEDEATTAVSAGLWTCHSNGYAGLVEQIIVQVNDWLNLPENRYEIVSLFFNGDYDRSRSEPISVALNDLLVSYWTYSATRHRGVARSSSGGFRNDACGPAIAHAHLQYYLDRARERCHQFARALYD